ncbi:MAG: 50S ribosomal protein L25 [Candidatus Eremiobacteraeota bacterium]|nr:50S ribosomal protein L25 [Candidatus Eremiobacteraeota bacterium]
MHQEKLKAIKRTRTGKESCKKNRNEGFIPGVIYGKNFDNVLVKVDAKELKKTLTTRAGTRVIINLDVENNGESTEYTTMVIEIQKDVFQKRYMHVDFHKISLDELVNTEVPIILRGEAIGVKHGGMMDQILWTVPFEALPLDLPELLEVDISHLDENDTLKVSDLSIKEGVKVLADSEELIAVVHPPRVMEEEETEAEEEATEEGAGEEAAAPSEPVAAG